MQVMLFIIYTLGSSLFFITTTLAMAKIAPKISAIVVIFGTIILLQLIPLPRNPWPYSDIKTYEPTSGEPWAIGLGYPASYLKLYLGYFNCGRNNTLRSLGQNTCDTYLARNPTPYKPGQIKWVGDEQTFGFNVLALCIFGIAPAAIILIIYQSLRLLQKKLVRSTRN